MDENLFINIQKYKPSKSNPKENFFTEIFGYIIHTNKVLGKKILNELFDIELKIDNYILSTQVHRGEYGQTDMEILINNTLLLIIEIKVDSSQGVGQLKKYLNLSEHLKSKRENHNKDYKIIYLTRQYENLGVDENYINKHIYWQQIYSIFVAHTETDPVNNYLLHQFIGLMKKENMLPYVKIDSQSLEGYNYLKNNIIILLEQVEQKIHNVYGDFGKGKLNTSRNYFERTSTYNHPNSTNVQIGLLLEDENFSFYIYKNNLSKNLENNIGEGFNENSWYYHKSKELDQNFFGESAEAQVELLSQFCIKIFDNIISKK